MLRTQFLNVSQIETERDISFTWKIRRVHSNYVWVCKFESACVCVSMCVCVCVMWKELGMDEQAAGWSSLTGSVYFCSELILRRTC